MSRFFLFVLSCLLITGCKINYFPQYYDEEVDTSEYIPLQQKYAKVIFGDSEEQIKDYIKNGYVILGKSIYVGENNTCPQILLEEFAREKGASIAFSIVTRAGSYQKTISSPGVAYTSGNLYGNSYSGFTTYSPPSSYTYTVNLYNQTTYYLAPKRR